MEEEEAFTFTIPWAIAAILALIAAYQLGRVLGMYHGIFLVLMKGLKNVND